MPRTIAIVGCLDTKGAELDYIRRVVEAQGLVALLIDTSVLGDSPLTGDVSAAEVAASAGVRLEDLRAAADRGAAVAAMARGAASVVSRLAAERRIDGILAAGGSANTTIGTAAMRVLPVGFPKVMVSTLASGEVSHYVDTKDICMMYSVVDIAGINRLSGRILANAARAVCAMAEGSSEEPASTRPLVAATMFGVTTPCVSRGREILEDAGVEVLVFHATGTGGRAMEGLIEDGYIAGVFDVTTTELADELVGGILSAGPRRLTVAGAAGVPQVVSVGAVDMVNFGPWDTVPERFRGRMLYRHNASVTLMRTTPEECREIGRRIGARLSPAKGPVEVILPLRGVSLYDREGGVFFDPAAGAACREGIRETIDARIAISELDLDFNDARFAEACAQALLRLMGTGRKAR